MKDRRTASRRLNATIRVGPSTLAMSVGQERHEILRETEIKILGSFPLCVSLACSSRMWEGEKFWILFHTCIKEQFFYLLTKVFYLLHTKTQCLASLYQQKLAALAALKKALLHQVFNGEL